MPAFRSFLARIFRSPEEQRLRAGWRLLLHTLLLTLILMGLLLALGIVGDLPGDLSSPASLIVQQVIEGVAVTASVWIARRYLDKRSFLSLGLTKERGAGRDLLAGILIAGVMMDFIFLLYLLFGWTQAIAYAWQEIPAADIGLALLLWAVIFLIVGWNEELWVRGYILQTLVDGTNVPWAVFLSSVIFGLLHLGNPNLTPASLLGLLVAGVFLALPWVWTRRLWLSIGLHIGWNFFEGTVFGFPVSGQDSFRLIRPLIRGPELWTGGAFGPEAGLVLLPAILLGTLLVWAYTRSTVR